MNYLCINVLLFLMQLVVELTSVRQHYGKNGLKAQWRLPFLNSYDGGVFNKVTRITQACSNTTSSFYIRNYTSVSNTAVYFFSQDSLCHSRLEGVIGRRSNRDGPKLTFPVFNIQDRLKQLLFLRLHVVTHTWCLLHWAMEIKCRKASLWCVGQLFWTCIHSIPQDVTT